MSMISAHTRRLYLVVPVAALLVGMTLTVAPPTAWAMDHTAVAPHGGFGHQSFGSFGREHMDGFSHRRFTPHVVRRGLARRAFRAPVVIASPWWPYYEPFYPDTSYGPGYGAPYADAPAPADTPAPVPLSNVYVTGNGYCCDYQTALGVQTACQQADGMWRFID